MSVTYISTAQALSSPTYGFNKNPNQFLKRIDPSIIEFSIVNPCLSYIRDFITISYDIFPIHLSPAREATRRIAKSLSKAISSLSYQSENTNPIMVEIFLGKIKIILNELENDCIRFKNTGIMPSLQAGGVEIQFTQSSFEALNNFESWDLVQYVTRKKEKISPFSINSEVIKLLSGITFVRG